MVLYLRKGIVRAIACLTVAACPIALAACRGPAMPPTTRQTTSLVTSTRQSLSPTQLPVLADADIDNEPVTLLELPPTHADLKNVTLKYFAAIGQSNADAIAALLAGGALHVDFRGQTVPLASRWSRRLERFDYRVTENDSPLWEPDIVVLSQDDDRAKAVVALLKPKPQDGLVVVPITKTRYAGQQLFGEVIWLQLRAVEAQWLIIASVEDFPLGR